MNKNKLKIKKGDTVYITTGRDKGKTGEVISLNSQTNRAVVQGIHLVKKHIKPNPNAGVEGGIKQIESSIDVSNLQIYNLNTKKKDKVIYKVNDQGKKQRLFKSDNELIDI